MAIARELLEILVCPVTKQPVAPLDAARLDKVNGLIRQGRLHAADGAVLDAPLQQALITQNGNTLYPVEGDVPIMLEARSIPCEQIEDW